MKTCLKLISVLLLATLASQAFGAKLNPSKRNAHRSEPRRILTLFENVEGNESNSALFEAPIHVGFAQDNAPFSILKLCGNTVKMHFGNDSGLPGNASRLNQVPIPGADWLLISGLIGLFHMTRQRIVRRIQ